MENIRKFGDVITPFKLAPVLIFLLSILPALMFVGYSIMVPTLLPSTELQGTLKILIIGIPIAILVYYGHRTGDIIGSIFSGALLFPLFFLYSQIFSQMFDPSFLMTPLSGLNWNIFIGMAPFILILSLLGYFASRKTNGSLLIALSLGVLAIVIILGIR